MTLATFIAEISFTGFVVPTYTFIEDVQAFRKPTQWGIKYDMLVCLATLKVAVSVNDCYSCVLLILQEKLISCTFSLCWQELLDLKGEWIDV
ncbi:hypothetical protein L2E82_19710 [Cichorium intybus]|uniref:Uncharacterized protein n=1 Tax=Cichorium intybus TaxID=13427 RepID=A0ACB9FCQ0_CICIN|nr:hypothetical protein L2E82_19710 [Cichorium intybus]